MKSKLTFKNFDRCSPEFQHAIKDIEHNIAAFKKLIPQFANPEDLILDFMSHQVKRIEAMMMTDPNKALSKLAGHYTMLGALYLFLLHQLGEDSEDSEHTITE